MSTSGFLRIPAPHRKALAALRDLSEEDFVALVNGLSEAPPYTSLGDLPDHITGVEGLDDEDVSDVVFAVLSLYTQVKFHDIDLQSLAERAGRSPDLPTTEGGPSGDVLTERLKTLLNTEIIRTTGRALDLLSEHERIFRNARLLTDVRPVFGDDPTQPPTGAVIVETLKLEYFGAGGDLQSFFVALDESDLRQLQKVVNRAVDKAESLRGFLEKAGLANFAVDGGETEE